MKKQISSAIALTVVLPFVGCTKVRIVVSAFVAPNTKFDGKTFLVAPARPEKKDSLEAQAYGEMLAQGLVKRNMIRVEEGKKADFVVLFDYEIDNGQLQSYSYPIFIPGQTFFATTNSTASVVGSYGSASAYGTSTTYGSTSGTVSQASGLQIVFTRKFTFAIYAPADGGSHRVYELSATSRGTAETFAQVAKPLIDAAVSDFPDNTDEPDVINKTLWQH